jgi:presenilin-like A22 family membrane protease
MTFRLSLFAEEALLFGATLIIGLTAAYRYAALTSYAPIIQAPSFTLDQIAFLAIVISFFVLATRLKRWGGYILWLFFILVVWYGVQILSDVFTQSFFGIFSGLIILLLFFSWRTVLMHDITVILALAGLSAIIGVSITPTVGIIALITLSFYDIIAVYMTRHMVQMAQSMVRSGAVFGFIIPSEIKLFLADQRVAREQIGSQFMILGSGDIALPLIFAASLMRQSLAEAIIVAVFAMLGVLATHLLFVGQHKRQAMAALPPIATMCLVGYLVALLFKF